MTDLIIAEDNQAVIKIVQKARSMALRHLPRAHRIDLQWLFEARSNPRMQTRYVGTLQHIADSMTKALNKLESWHRLLSRACCTDCGFVRNDGPCVCNLAMKSLIWGHALLSCPLLVLLRCIRYLDLCTADVDL